MVAVGLGHDACVHLDLAANFDANRALISQGTLFRVEAAAAVLAALLVLVSRHRAVAFYAVIIAGSALLLLIALTRHGNGELGNTYSTLWAGVPRVLFSFLAGVLLFRFQAKGRLVHVAISPLILAAVLFGALAVPRAVPWFYDASCIFILFPLILIAAVNNEPTARWTSAARISADLSYPLYLFHLPLMLWLGFGLTHFGVAAPVQQLFALIAVPSLAYAAHLFFDSPLQSILKARLSTIRPPIAATPDARAL